MPEKKKSLSSYSLLLVAVLMTVALVPIGKNILSFLPNTLLQNSFFDKHLKYQLFTLALSAVFIGISFLLKPSSAKSYFGFGKLNAEVKPVPAIGLKPKENENWVAVGINFLFVIAVVTGVVIYFQVVASGGFHFEAFKMLHWIVLLSFFNSFVEEILTRFGVVVALEGILSDKFIPFVSGGIFGLVHYFGNPGGIPGVLLAGFLGWFLAKSMLETKGFFWAWVIHFVQDVLIFSALYMGTFSL